MGVPYVSTRDYRLKIKRKKAVKKKNLIQIENLKKYKYL